MHNRKNGIKPQIIGPIACMLFLVTSIANAEGLGNKAPTTPITITVAKSTNLEVWESSVGQLEARTAPMIAAEVGGRISTIVADEGEEVEIGQVLAQLDKTDFLLAQDVVKADIKRLEYLIKARKLQTGRLRNLVRKKSATQASLDDAEAGFGALKAEMLSAQVRLKQAKRNVAKAEIVSPVSGRVDDRRISVGDYVQIGTPLFHITARDHLKVRLPFPESLSSKLRTGLPVQLISPVAPDVKVNGKITDIRPLITPENRAIDVIVDVQNPGTWEPGASVTGKVQVARHESAVIVPEISVVRRPAGTVVYVIEDGIAKQRIVKTGLRLDGQVEILTGLQAGEEVAMDGAGFLTDGGSVEVKKS
ncbi:MAG: efflux transporter periplasmic adaptor subunit [Rhodospirillaceae bacterium]|nr:MAG: efflux transporter periplasmic adaptor subunit [Rhodospirillaceae bacterium]